MLPLLTHTGWLAMMNPRCFKERLRAGDVGREVGIGIEDSQPWEGFKSSSVSELDMYRDWLSHASL